MLDKSPLHSDQTDRAYLHLLHDVAFRPVFIIGDHRSGTTLLYQLLSTTGAFNVLTAYQVIRYGEILANHVRGATERAQAELAALFAAEGLADRVIDGVRVTPGLPEEYGFAIAADSRPALSRTSLPRLVELCRKLRYLGDDKPVLLKNPWDVLQFAFLKEAFAGAKFLFIHRHPLHVMNSQLQATRSLFAARNGYVAMLSPWYASLFERPLALAVTRAMAARTLDIGARVTGRHVVKVTRYYLKHVNDLPREDYIELRYEDLCADPDRTLASVLGFLQLDAGAAPSLREHVRPRAAPVLPEVQRQYRRIRNRLARYCSIQGYGMDP